MDLPDLFPHAPVVDLLLQRSTRCGGTRLTASQANASHHALGIFFTMDGMDGHG